jgi:membrane-associated phospholipid phosphatase
MATVLSEYQPKYKWLAYGGASVIAWSRVETHAHRWRDVVAGAVLGHTIAKRFARKRIALTPEGLGFQMEW